MAAALGCAEPAAAQEKSAVKPGFSIDAHGPARILLIRPTVKVGEQSTAGLFEPNADWTDQAKANIKAALTAAQGVLGNSVIEQVEPIGPEAEKLAQYRALFPVVAEAVINYKFFAGNRLPTKKRDGVFDWTLGRSIADMPGARDADYALFIYTEDHYGSTGRKVLQVLAAVGGIGITSGVHKGYAGLIDLKTGDLVWLNADMQMGGDVRTAEGAQKRVAQLLEDFPGRGSGAAIVAAGAR